MGIFDIFKKKRKKEQDIQLVGYSLDNLKVGDVVELEGESWEVKGIGYYDYNGEKEWDFRIQSPTKEGFLNKDDHGMYFFVKSDVRKLSLDPITYLKTHEELPDKIIFDDKNYKLIYSGAAYYVKDDQRLPVIIWDYEGNNGELLEILQWGDEDFEVFVGRTLEEWEIEDVFSK